LKLFFLDAQPTEAEKPVYDEAQVVLERAFRILQELQDYKGASQEIRKAISTPDVETEKQAWDAVLPLVSKLKDFYLFSKELGKVLSVTCSVLYGSTECFVRNFAALI